MKVVGLTGPTGAGKSVFTALLRQEGIPVVDADLLAREVTQKGHPCLAALVAAFSPAILNPDGTLNRRELASRAFATPESTRLLNQITHPHIIALADDILSQWEREGVPLAVVDAPLLFESGMAEKYDRNIAVLAPADIRLKRIIARDTISEQQARLRMSAQQSDSFYRERADEVLVNDGDLSDFEAKCRNLIARLKEWSLED